MNEVRTYLLAQREPVPADSIRHALQIAHERLYECLVRLEAMHQARVVQFKKRLCWEYC